MRILTYEQADKEYYTKKVSEQVKKKVKREMERKGIIFLEYKITDWQNRIKNINKFVLNSFKKMKLESYNLKFIFSSVINVYDNKFMIEVYPGEKTKEPVNLVEKIEEYLQK